MPKFHEILRSRKVFYADKPRRLEANIGVGILATIARLSANLTTPRFITSDPTCEVHTQLDFCRAMQVSSQSCLAARAAQLKNIYSKNDPRVVKQL